MQCGEVLEVTNAALKLTVHLLVPSFTSPSICLAVIHPSSTIWCPLKHSVIHQLRHLSDREWWYLRAHSSQSIKKSFSVFCRRRQRLLPQRFRQHYPLGCHIDRHILRTSFPWWVALNCIDFPHASALKFLLHLDCYLLQSSSCLTKCPAGMRMS